MDAFVFNKLADDEYKDFLNSPVFNYTREKIESEVIDLNSVSDERLGSAEEHLDIYLHHENDSWELLDLTEMGGYNSIPLSSIIKGKDYQDVMVVIRAMSNFTLDKKEGHISVYIYHVVPVRYAYLDTNNIISGILAKNRIYFKDENSYNELEEYDKQRVKALLDSK